MFTPAYIKEGQQLLKAAKKVVNYRKDIAKPEALDRTRKTMDALKAAIKEKAPDKVEELGKKLVPLIGKVQPPHDHDMIREYVELILVAVVCALGIRTYYLAPFKIPTGSMQPTLNGIIAHATNNPPPNFLVRAFQLITLGRTYEDVVSDTEGDTVVDIRPVKLRYFWDGSEIVMSSNRAYRVGIDPRVLQSQLNVVVGRTFHKGEPIVRGYADLGDQLFVDRFSYNFVPPRRGEVFVFRTNGIEGIREEGLGGLQDGAAGQSYIKRLAGVPGDTLRIDQPKLFINGPEAAEAGFKRVESQQNGYTGYRNGAPEYLRDPNSTVTVPANNYFALGDNSANSADSRYWGFVPGRNIVGKGFFVYWPFTSHWGFVK
jgi:signal peptidase I